MTDSHQLQRVGKYEIKRAIGRGGAGTVYLAIQPGLEREVALKLLNQSIVGGRAEIEVIKREALALARVEHPAIVPVHEFGLDNDPPFIAMRFLGGGSLRDRLSAGPQSLESVGLMALQIGSALDAVHKKNIVHADVKPSNILFDDESNAYLGDFGIAWTGTVPFPSAGSAPYVSPERTTGSEPSPSWDIYGLAMTCYEAIAGRPAFADKNTTVVLDQQRYLPAPDIRSFQPGVPQTVAAVLAKALEKESKNRFPKAGEFAAALVRAANGEPAPSTSGWSRRRLITAGAGGSIAIAAVGVLGALGLSKLGDSGGTETTPDPQNTKTPREASPTTGVLATLTPVGATQTPAATAAATATPSPKPGDTLLMADWSRDFGGWVTREFTGWSRASTGQLVNDGKYRDFVPSGEGDRELPSMAAPDLPLGADHAIEAEFEFLAVNKAFDPAIYGAGEGHVSFGIMSRGRSGQRGGYGYLFGVSLLDKAAVVCGGSVLDRVALSSVVIGPGSVWKLRAELRGVDLLLRVNDGLEVRGRDARFPGAGRVGVWASGVQVIVRSFRVIAV